MELVAYYQILRQRIREILITTLIVVAVASIGRSQVPTAYESSAVVRVVPYSTDNPSYTQLLYADRIMKTYVEIGSGSVIMSNLRDDLGLSPDQPKSIKIEIIPDTELLRVNVEDTDPILATDVANALAAQLINDKSIRDVRVTLMEPATAPESPSKLSVILFYVLALMVGLMGGIGLAFLLENIDPRLRNEKQAENIAGVLSLGYIPSVSKWQRDKIFARRFPYNHAFQRLSVNAQSALDEKSCRTVVITSAEPDEGKSITAANLAYSMAVAGSNVLLIDADLHRPTIHRYFKIANDRGLSSLLFSDGALKDVIQETELPSLSIIAGGVVAERREDQSLDGKRIAKMLEQLAQEYDYVILDSPAFLGFVDGYILARLTDAIFLVARSGITRQASLADAARQLGMIPSKVFRLVVNGAPETSSAYRNYSEKRKNILLTLTKGRVRAARN